MKAAILKAFGTPLVVETLPDPLPGAGEVVVDVVAAPVLSYAAQVFSGEQQYPMLFGKPKEIAEAVVFLASPKAAFINGENLTVDGGWSA